MDDNKRDQDKNAKPNRGSSNKKTIIAFVCLGIMVVCVALLALLTYLV